MQNPLENFKNPWDADGEFAQSFLNVDKVLNLDALFGKKNNKEENTTKKLPIIYYEVVIFPKAQQNINFDVNIAISIVNMVLRRYTKNYVIGEDNFLKYKIEFRKYIGNAKKMRKTVFIGQNHIELKESLKAYVSAEFYQYCGTMLSYDSTLKAPDGSMAWYPEVASTIPAQGGSDCLGVIRLDHLGINSLYNELVYGVPYSHNVNLAFLILHILGHNVTNSGHGSNDTGIMASGSLINKELRDAQDLIHSENSSVPPPMWEIILAKPNDISYVGKLINELFATTSPDAPLWASKYGINGNFIYDLFNKFKDDV
jgi:hypothetical protein